MALIKDGQLVDDIFVMLDDESDLPPGTHAAIVSVDRWQTDGSLLVKSLDQVGIILQPDQSPDLIAGDIDKVSVVAVNFPVFSDGRGFSHARRLRENLGYEGEIRATGHLIRDQYLFLHRCGFDAIQVADPETAEQWKIAMKEFSLFYQNTVDDRTPLMRRRHAARS
jgi:uncharacterized protein (DUF934 family)